MEKNEIRETVKYGVNKEVHLPDEECVVAIYRWKGISSPDAVEDDINDGKLDDIISHHPLWKRAGVYEDNGKPGEEFERLISDCKKGKVDLILTQSMSWLFLHYEETIKRIRELKNIGVGVYFLDTGIYTLDNMFEFVLRVLTTITLEESRMKSMRLADKDGTRFKELQFRRK